MWGLGVSHFSLTIYRITDGWWSARRQICHIAGGCWSFTVCSCSTANVKSLHSVMWHFSGNPTRQPNRGPEAPAHTEREGTYQTLVCKLTISGCWRGGGGKFLPVKTFRRKAPREHWFQSRTFFFFLPFFSFPFFFLFCKPPALGSGTKNILS